MRKQYQLYVMRATATFFLLGLFFLGQTADAFSIPSLKNKNKSLDIGQRIEERINKVQDRLCARLEKIQERYPFVQTSLSFCNEGPTPLPDPTLTLSGDPLSVLSGATSTLSWTSTNATSCEASSGWSGNKSLSGTEVVTVNSTSTYTLTCGNGSATTTQSVIVNAIPVPTLDFTATPPSIVNGATSTLAWTTTNVTTCVASDGWTGGKAVSGQEIVSLTATTTYSLLCGNGLATTSKSVTVNVSPVPLSLPVLDFNVTFDVIAEGATTTLSWSVQNATSCTASGGWSGSKPLSGTEIISPTATTSYILICTGDGGNAQTTLSVGVTPAPEPVIGHVVISEVFYDVDSLHGEETLNEWVELYNGTNGSIDLSGWTIGDNASSSADALSQGTVIPAQGFLVITSSSTTASLWTIPLGVNVVVLSDSSSIGGNGLANTSDVVFLNNGNTVVDAVSYGGNISAFDPSVLDVIEGHSIARDNFTVDSNTASDWEDSILPTPGTF